MLSRMERPKILVLFIYFLPDFLTIHGSPLAGTDPRYMPEIQASMAMIIRNYVELQTNKMDVLKKYAEQLEARSLQHKTSEINPIAMYRTVEELFQEWSDLYEDMGSTTLTSVLASNFPMPQFQDLAEIARAFFRIQDVYQLSAQDIADGRVPGLDTFSRFTASDCYNLGGTAFAINDHYHALMWFLEALSRLPKDDPLTMDKFDILPPLAVSMHKKMNKERAKKMAVEFEKEASSIRIQQAIDLYPDFKLILEQAKKDGSLDSEDPYPFVNHRVGGDLTPEQPKYELLCRQEYKKEIPLANATYSCYYDRTFPYLLLAPVKVEVLRHDPLIKVFRQVIGDEEIKVLKMIAMEKFDRSRVIEVNISGVLLTSRESFTTRLVDEKNPVVERVRRRAVLFTHLKMKSLEDLQISQYGVGGHYLPHYDHLTNEHKSDHSYVGGYQEDGVINNRLATIMFYLVAPEHGGGTAFPYADLVVKPTKNDAVFWFNLRASGNSDYNTFHAGCPVISGSKWIANQWIRERGQEFSRPCNLVED